MAQEPIFSTETQADDQGLWNVDVFQDLPEGYHKVIVVDEDGNQDDVNIFVDTETVVEREQVTLQEPAQLIDRVQSIFPIEFVWALLILFLFILLLAGNMIRLARKVDKTGRMSSSHQRQNKATLISIGITFVVIAAVLVIGIVLNQRTGFFDSAVDLPLSEELRVRVDGAVVNPATRQPVVGLDLTAGDTSIRTGEGARFRFDDISAKEGIRMNHPELFRSVVRRITEAAGAPEDPQSIQILFDVDLMNTMIRISDFESRSKDGEIYDFLHPQAAARMSRESFISAYSPIFTEENMGDQSLVLGPATLHTSWNSLGSDTRFEQVVELVVYNGDISGSYFFTKTEKEWYLLDVPN